MEIFWKAISATGLFFVLLLCSVGTYWAYLRGGNDFNVFYEAWRLVLSGHGDLIYRVSPDRFLYSPGFAWLLAPLGLFSRNIALGIWCFAKTLVVFFLVRKLAEVSKFKARFLAIGATAWGVGLLAKPILIDFSYGQVNLFILGACIWGLFGHFEKKGSIALDGCRWTLLTFAAVAKLYPLTTVIINIKCNNNKYEAAST